MAKVQGKKVDPLRVARDQQLGASAQRLMVEGRINEAAQILEELHERYPDEPSVVFNLGVCRMGQLNHGEARRLMQRACAFPKAPADTHALLAVCHIALQDLADAEREVGRALAKDPSSTRALRVSADLLNLQGKPNEGMEAVRPVVERDPADGQSVATFAKCCRSAERRAEGLAALERSAAIESMSGESRAAVLYELAAEYEKLGRYDEAWGAGAEANRLRPTQHTAEGWEGWVDQRLEAFSAERMARLPRSRRDGTGLVFIVGMPRSGTTLVEQILASHPEVRGIGERQIIPMAARELTMIRAADQRQRERFDSFSAAGIDRVARGVLAELREAGGGARVIADKLMQNFLHAGVIELLLPGARIVHCVRDPRDTCVSCFLQHFPGPENQAYSRDVGTLAHYYRQYVRLMEHWRVVLSMPILEVRYESIVEDKEREARRLIEFAGLEWDAACLESHRAARAVVTLSADQVRRPMYRSSMGRWERFERHLGPILELV